MSPVPHTEKLHGLVWWAKSQFKPMVDPDPASGAAIVLDLSVESPLVDVNAVQGDTDQHVPGNF